jgi:hypothetical protein
MRHSCLEKKDSGNNAHRQSNKGRLLWGGSIKLSAAGSRLNRQSQFDRQRCSSHQQQQLSARFQAPHTFRLTPSFSCAHPVQCARSSIAFNTSVIWRQRHLLFGTCWSQTIWTGKQSSARWTIRWSQLLFFKPSDVRAGKRDCFC